MPDFRLDRLTLAPIIGSGGKPTQSYQRLWQKTVEKIEAAFIDLSDQLAAIQAAQAAADAAQADADAAQTAANTASSTAIAAAREAARISSYPNPAAVLSAADVGATATITVAAHTRVYPVQGSVDVPDVAVGGGTVTGLAFSTEYFVYYDDTTLASTTPTYQATTTAATAQVGAAAGRHYVGSITTPADGGGGTSGVPPRPPGGGQIP